MTNELINFIILFTICSFVNVILNTVKTIVMYKRNPNSSGLINMITYGFYTYLVILMAGDMPTIVKVIITMITNYIGVAIATIILNKLEKDKLWEIRLTCKNSEEIEEIEHGLTNFDIPYNTHKATNGTEFTVFNIYCESQKQSLAVKEIIKNKNVKYFVSESKTL